jgi:IclR family KDG regulon transcriptional repressor
MWNKMTSPKIVNSITKGANILKCLSDGIDRISDLSKELHLSKSTTHRFLKSLENSGLAMQDPITRRYHLGHLILYLASQPNVSHQRLIDSAAEEMQHLET